MVLTPVPWMSSSSRSARYAKQRATKVRDNVVRNQLRRGKLSPVVAKLDRRREFAVVDLPATGGALVEVIELTNQRTEISARYRRSHDGFGPGVVRIIDAVSPAITER